MGPSRTTRRARAGYTLVELMIIVTIIGTSVLLFAPGFSRAMSDRRVSTAARELIRLGRRARSDTFGYLRAHLLWVQPATGRLQLLRGPNQSCTTATWATIQADCPDDVNTMVGQRCLENINLTVWARGGDMTLREERLVAGVPAYSSVSRALCFAPSGQLFLGNNNSLATAAAALRDINDVNGGVVFTLHAGTANPVVGTDVIHRVLFPLGGTPRALR